jgi:hypothetical protein
MAKRKTKSPSQHARRPKIAAKAQRANQAVVRSSKEGRLRLVAGGSIESPKREPEASLGDSPMTAVQDDNKPKDIVSSKGFDFPSATTNVRAYQAKLVEVTQANVQFAVEYAQRLATIRSPVEILNVIVEFTSKGMAMFQKHLIEMAELSTKR